MRFAKFAGCIFVFMAVSFFAVPVSAIDCGLALPSTIVCIEVRNGVRSYFNTSLSQVPLGCNVTNGTYLGWSVDAGTSISRSPASHDVRLFSSVNPPSDLASKSWNMINYVLNHKHGAMADVQQAIWYFADIWGNYTPTRKVAWEIVNETLEKGETFVPAETQQVAVICYPLKHSHQPNVQVSIIEVGGIDDVEFPIALALVTIIFVILGILIYRKERSAHQKREEDSRRPAVFQSDEKTSRTNQALDKVEKSGKNHEFQCVNTEESRKKASVRRKHRSLKNSEVKTKDVRSAGKPQSNLHPKQSSSKKKTRKKRKRTDSGSLRENNRRDSPS